MSRSCAARSISLHLGEASIQEFGSAKTFQIRLPKPPGGDAAANAAATQVKQLIATDYPGARVDSVESCRARSARSSPQNSAIAIALAMLGIAIYIWFRFEWQFGVGALLTLAHDIAMTLGFFAFTRLQVDLNVVAAFLTIVGYSLNDTVVIYDRIRENLRKYRKMAILPLLNLSLNETLARTVVTSLTVLIALGVLMLIGPEVIFGLAIAIFLGVVIGTYSSIYISAPVLVWLGVQPDSFLKADEKEERRGPARLISVQRRPSFRRPCPAWPASGAHANEVSMLKLSRSACPAPACAAAVLPLAGLRARRSKKGRHGLCRPRRQLALHGGQADDGRRRLRAGGQAVRRGRAPAPLFGLGPPRAADERVQLLSCARNIPTRSTRRSAS